jgi:hypothetical protein
VKRFIRRGFSGPMISSSLGSETSMHPDMIMALAQFVRAVAALLAALRRPRRSK